MSDQQVLPLVCPLSDSSGLHGTPARGLRDGTLWCEVPSFNQALISSSAWPTVALNQSSNPVFKNALRTFISPTLLPQKQQRGVVHRACRTLMLTSEPLRLCAGFLFRENRHGTRFLIESQPLLPILISKQGFTCVPGHPCHGVALLESIVVTNVDATVT